MSTAIDVALAGHRLAERRRLSLTLALAGAVAASFVFDVATGPALLRPGEVVATLLDPAGADGALRAIVWDLRLPMAVMALVVGLALGTSGAAMQTLLDNPLASPYTLGLAAAAGFGASLAIQFGGWGLNALFMVPACAFGMSCVAVAIILGVGNVRGMMGDTMILAGIAVMFLFTSLQSLIQYRATPEVGQQLVFWMFGSLAKANWTNILVTAATMLIALPYLMRRAWQMTAVRLGEDRARSLGVGVGRLRLVAIVLVSLMTATAISFVGTIGFVGLVAPHIARMLVGEDQRFLLPLAGIAGAAMLSLSSVASKIIVPGALVPIGIVTALVGVPFFFHLVVTRQRSGR